MKQKTQCPFGITRVLDAACFKRHTAQRGQAEPLNSHDGLKPSLLGAREGKRQHQPVCEAYCAFSPCHEKQNCLHTFSARCRPPGLQKRRGSEAGRNALDSKSSYRLIPGTWVRIPPSPPLLLKESGELLISSSPLFCVPNWSLLASKR